MLAAVFEVRGLTVQIKSRSNSGVPQIQMETRQQHRALLGWALEETGEVAKIC
jgi:NTP pyrophosphatase (non-canonical NTP hydrolase)